MARVYLTIPLATIAVLAAICGLIAATSASILLVIHAILEEIDWSLEQITTQDQSIYILHGTLGTVAKLVVLLVFSGCGVLLSSCGVFLSLFFTGVVGSVFGFIDLFLAAPVLIIWRVIPQRWEYRRD